MTRKPPPTGGTHAGRIRRERGADKAEPPPKDLLTPDEMLEALRSEVVAVSRAAEMQIREMTIIATDYARGRTSAEEANARYLQHSRRWHDPLYGISSFEGRSDEAILQEMDDVRRALQGGHSRRPDADKDKGRPR